MTGLYVLRRVRGPKLPDGTIVLQESVAIGSSFEAMVAQEDGNVRRSTAFASTRGGRVINLGSILGGGPARPRSLRLVQGRSAEPHARARSRVGAS